MYQLYRDRPALVLAMIVANFVLSAWAIYLDPVINNDGVLYIGLAQLFQEGQWSAAFDYYSWPFYSILIAFVSTVTHLNLEHSAIFLDTLFACSLTLAFVSIVAQLSKNDRQTILIAALIILLFPSISKYRSFIIRDFGYLSCYLWSFYFLIRYCYSQKRKHLVGWLIFAAASCLFRFEGIAFLLVAPYFLFLFSSSRLENKRVLVLAFSLFLIISALVLLYWYVNDKYATSIKVAQLQGQDINNVFELFLANTQARLEGHELSALNYARMFASNTGEVVYELIRRMAIFYFAFAIFAYYKGWGLKQGLTKRIWIVYVVTNLAMLWVFVLYNQFLASRYTMATALTLLILAPFVVTRIISGFGELKIYKRIFSAVAISLLTLASVEGLDLRTKKLHIKQAGEWLRKNTEDGARIYSNDKLVMYYANENTSELLREEYNNLRAWEYLKTKRLERDFDYVGVEVFRKDADEDFLRRTVIFNLGRPVKVFSGKQGRMVLIHKIKSPTHHKSS